MLQMLSNMLLDAKEAKPPPVFRGSSFSTSTAANSKVVNVPTGTVVGDLLIAFGYKSGSRTFTLPSGWTLLGGVSGSQNSSFFAYRVYQSGDPSSFEFAANTPVGTFRVAMAGFYDATGVDEFGTIFVDTSQSAAIPEITPTQNGMLLVLAANQTRLMTAHSPDLSELLAIGNAMEMVILNKEPSPAGIASGVKSITWAANSGLPHAVQLQIY